MLMPGLGPILGKFDGQNSRQDLANQFASFGVTLELVDQLSSLLDSHFYLNTPVFHQHVREVKQSFDVLPERPNSLAALNYSSDPAELKRQLAGWLSAGRDLKFSSSPLLTLVSPHIDYRRGSSCYGRAYQALNNQEHDLHILIGTAHQYSPHTFHLCDKDFHTPLRLLPCDHNFMADLALGYGAERSYADQYLHKQEHSLELQTPFLANLDRATKIAPILVGSFYNFLKSGKYPEEYEHYESFAVSLTQAIQQRIQVGQRIAFIAGVDMAHIGQYFGDQNKLTPAFLEQVRERDQQYLKLLCQQNAHALFDHIAEDLDARRICGFPSMYLILDVLKRLGLTYTAETIDYQQAVNTNIDCAVTFAGMAFYQQPSAGQSLC